jgi:hypothetical protein
MRRPRSGCDEQRSSCGRDADERCLEHCSERCSWYDGDMSITIDIAVPSAIADEVRRFAAFILADRSAGVVDAHVPASDGIADYPLWSDDDVVSLAKAGTTTAANYRKIMDAVIDQDAVGKWVSITELAHWTGEKSTVIANFRTQLYRWINAHFPEGKTAPFTAKRGDKLRPPRGRQVHYRVSAACASQWDRVRQRIVEI